MRRLSTELASNPCTPGAAATTLPGSGIWRLPRTSSVHLDAFGRTRSYRRDDNLSDRTQNPRYLAPCPNRSRALRLITAETRMIPGGSVDPKTTIPQNCLFDEFRRVAAPSAPIRNWNALSEDN